MSWVAVAGAAVSVVGGAIANHGTNAAAANANNASANAATTQAQIAQDQYNDWKTDFLPLQHDLAGIAKDAGSQRELDTAAEHASGDVTQAFGRARTGLNDQLTSYGVDPSSSKYATTFGRFNLGEAAADAGAQNKARTDVMDKAKALKMDIYSIGKGIPASSMAGLGSAAGTNAMVANNLSANASRSAAGLGAFAQKIGPAISDWWRSSTAPASGPGGNSNTGWSNDYTTGAMGP